MRHLLTSALTLALAGCSFYQPDLIDCLLPCGDGGVCPGAMACVEGLCRAAGRTQACECVAGKTRPCGTNVGACKEGVQQCTRDGVWGACTGGIEPSEEVCDGRDNDCDGRTDFTASTLLVEDWRPYTTYETRLFARSGGYALVYYGALPDAGPALLAQRFDQRFSPLDTPMPMHPVDWSRSAVAATQEVMVGAVSIGNGLVGYMMPMTPGAPSVPVLDIPDAGYERRLWTAMLPDGGARISWCTLDTVHVADVPLAGGAPTLRTYRPEVDAGALVDFVQSSAGRYGLVQVDANPDGGAYLNVLFDLQTLRAVRAGVAGYAYPFRRGRSWLQDFNGRLPYVSDWDEVNTPTRVTFTYDLVASDNGVDVLPPGTGRWGESATTLMPDGRLLFAISDLTRQAITLAAIQGTGFTNYEVVLRSLPENSGFGPPMVAVSRDDEMVGLAWITNRGVYARRVCAPYVGD
jgi:hypothetical protein